VDAQYAPSGCPPPGKVSKVPEAYGPNAAVVWAHQYTFDGLDRMTLYAYSGNTTRRGLFRECGLCEA
jgi:hypothetical protein